MGQCRRDLARTVVDLLLNLLEPFLRDGGEVMSFGEILPDKPVVVLHTALFLGMVGFAEIALAFQQLASQTVLCELKPIVIGDSVHLLSFIVSLLCNKTKRIPVSTYLTFIRYQSESAVF